MTNGSYFAFHTVDWGSMWGATWETIWMTLVSMVVVVILGILLDCCCLKQPIVTISWQRH